jgi:CheY-specific phosphatase CheX
LVVTTDSTTEVLPNSDAIGQAVKDILMMSCGAVVEPAEELGDEICEDGAIISVISVMGDVDWSIYLGLPRDTAVTLSEAFAGFEIPFDSEDMGDAIGEVTNILAGNVKQILDKRGINVEISLPSVMRVDGLHVLKQRDSHTAKNCWQCSMGYLWTGVVAGKDADLVA